jgi:hypothetical protein
MNAKGPKPSQELHSREALAPVFADLNKYDATTYFVGQNTIFTLSGQQSHGGSVFPSGTTAPEPSACVSTRRRPGFARGRACLRERFTSPTSKPPSCPPTFPFERIPRLSDRPNDSSPHPEVFAWCTAAIFGQRPHTTRLRAQSHRESQVCAKPTPFRQWLSRLLRAGRKNENSGGNIAR